jgi:hypothetical protein
MSGKADLGIGIPSADDSVELMIRLLPRKAQVESAGAVARM